MITNTTVHEMKVRSSKINSVLTTYARGDSAQAQVLASWQNKAGRIIIISNSNTIPGIDEASNTNGVVLVPTKESQPPLVELLDYYVKKGGPEEVVILAAPNVEISDNHKALYDYVDQNKKMRAWCGWIRPDGAEAINSFVVSGYVLQFLAKQIPENITLSGPDWAKWVDNWFKRSLSPDRYFDASNLGLVSHIPIPAIPSHSEAVSGTIEVKIAPLPIGALKATETPVKRKRGRPPGSKAKKAEVTA